MNAKVKYFNPTYVFEFGSVHSTKLFIDFLNSGLLIHLYCVDHSPFSLQKNIVGENEQVTFYLCSIALYQFRWKGFVTCHSANTRQIPQGTKFDLVLIDGPSGRRFGREAPLYQLAPFLTPQTLILLDDSNRVHVKQSIANWQRVWPGGIEFLQFSESDKEFSILQVKNPREMMRFPFRATDIVQSWPRAIKRVQGVRVRAEK